MFASEEVVDVGPVGYQHAIPSQVNLQPLCEVLVAGMYRNAIDRGRVDHHCQGSCLCCTFERLKILLAYHLWREVCRCTVLTCPGSTVGKIVLHAGSNVVLVNMVGVITLITFDLSLHHTCIDNGILAKALPDTWPTRVASQVDDGVINPRAVSCSTLVGCYLCSSACQFGVEGSGKIDGLWEECASLCVGYSMVVVQSIDVGNTDVFHGFLLYQLNPFLPLFNSGGTCAWGIQDGTYFPFANDSVEHCLVELPLAVGIVTAHNVQVQFEHLANFLVQCHFSEC